jgi:1,4-dihydroxy-2-naphthoate octaprenyltransferase
MEVNVRSARPGDPSPGPANSDWRIWWRLLRPHTLTASFIPVAIGTVFALLYGPSRFSLFLAMLLASMLIQAATNMFNEYFDYRQGLDNKQSVGIGGTIVRDGVEPQTVLRLALGAIAFAFLLGFYLCSQTSWWLLPVGLVCIAIGYLYSGGPYPISATPFGEIVSGLAMGLVIITIAFFIQTGFVNPEVILVSIPTSILIGAILLSNNIRDLEGDKLHGRLTLAILLGKRSATALLAGLFALAYLWTVYLTLSGVVTYWALLGVASLPKAAKAVKGFSGGASPGAMMPAMVATAQTNTLFGLFFTLGLLLEYLAG